MVIVGETTNLATGHIASQPRQTEKRSFQRVKQTGPKLTETTDHRQMRHHAIMGKTGLISNSLRTRHAIRSFRMIGGTRRVWMQVCLLSVLILAAPDAALVRGDWGNPRDIEFVATCDQTRQKYVLVLPEDFSSDKKHDVLIVLHGHGSNRWQFIKQQRDECRAVRDFVQRHHMLLVSPDYRASTSWMGPKAEADLLQIIEQLKSTYAIRRVFLCGASMGGTACLTFTALHPKLIDGVASMNGTANLLEYNNFQTAIQESFGGKKADIPTEYKRRSAEYWPERFTMPLAIAVGGQDRTVPPDSVLRLAKIVKTLGNKQVLVILRDQGGHSTNYRDATAVLQWLIDRTR